MNDWRDNASKELKEIIDTAMDSDMHEDFDNFYDFLHMCVDHYKERNEDYAEKEQDIVATTTKCAYLLCECRVPKEAKTTAHLDTEPPCFCTEGYYGGHDDSCQYLKWKRTRG